MRASYLIIFYSIIFILLLQSCTNNSIPTLNTTIPQKEPKVSIPAPLWFTSGQDNTDEDLYGFGSANNIGDAKRNALADMTQRLQVIVSTETTFQNISNNDKVSQKLIQQVTTRTTDINIPNYSIVNQEIVGNIYYVELQINKQQTIHELEKTINSKLIETARLINNAKNKDSLFRFDISQKVNSNIRLIKSSLRTLLILEPDIDINTYMQDLNNIDNDSINLKRNLQLYVNKQDSGYFYSALDKFLRTNDYKITTNKNLASIYITLKLRDYDNTNINNKYCINTKIELQATDNTSGQLSPKLYTIRTCSNNGRLAAIDKAVEIFYSQLDKADSIY